MSLTFPFVSNFEKGSRPIFFFFILSTISSEGKRLQVQETQNVSDVFFIQNEFSLRCSNIDNQDGVMSRKMIYLLGQILQQYETPVT